MLVRTSLSLVVVVCSGADGIRSTSFNSAIHSSRAPRRQKTAKRGGFSRGRGRCVPRPPSFPSPARSAAGSPRSSPRCRTGRGTAAEPLIERRSPQAPPTRGHVSVRPSRTSRRGSASVRKVTLKSANIDAMAALKVPEKPEICRFRL